MKDANKDGVPQLWKNEDWSVDFFEFIQALISNGAPPEVIEIHPPFDDYCCSIDHFLDIYETFEKSVSEPGISFFGLAFVSLFIILSP